MFAKANKLENVRAIICDSYSEANDLPARKEFQDSEVIQSYRRQKINLDCRGSVEPRNDAKLDCHADKSARYCRSQLPLRRNAAFTLAEVLITLVIIGVIAAISVPALYSNFRKQELKSAFMKSYSELNKFAEKYYADNGISFSEYAWLHNYDNNYKEFKRYLTTTKDAHGATAGGHNENYFHKALKGSRKINSICDDYGLFADAGGRLYGLNNPNKENENGPVVCVDTNGDRGPNRYGYDFFIFFFTVDNRALPMGAKHENNTSATLTSYNFFVQGSDYCSKTKTSYTGGITCSYYALANQHPTQSGKKYWEDFLN